MSKNTSLSAAVLLLLLLFSFTLSSAARRQPTFVPENSSVKPLYEEVESEMVGESCEGAADKDGCLMRRTLAAHTDYIYTQKLKP